MANTRDILGDQATLDALVADTLSSFEENNLKNLRQYGIYKRNTLQTLKLNISSKSSMQPHAITDCSNLKEIELNTNMGSIFSSRSNNNLEKLILSNSNTINTLYAVNSLPGTKIAKMQGAIFVPSNLLSDYKTSSNYLPYRYLIFPIGSSPETNHYATITDSWTDILAACNDGTYVSKYNVGDTAAVLIDGNYYLFEIVAKCNDMNTATADTAEPLSSDNTKFAHLTWLLANCYSSAKMNTSSTNAGGWDSSAIKSWLNSTVFALLPQELQNGILAVDKTCQQGSADSGATTTSTNNKLWLPSAREIFGGSSYESSGLVYTAQFSAQNARIKFDNNGITSNWWTRSAHSDNTGSFRFVGNGGTVSYGSASNSNGVTFGFCT